MQRCSPTEMRKNLAVVELYRQQGMDFVPIPAKNEEHKRQLIEMMEQAFNDIISDAEEEL